LGGALGVGIATNLTPNAIGKGLVKFDKMVNVKKHLIDTASKTAKKVGSERNLAIGRALLGRLVAGSK